jgi:hypothetical protein
MMTGSPPEVGLKDPEDLETGAGAATAADLATASETEAASTNHLTLEPSDPPKLGNPGAFRVAGPGRADRHDDSDDGSGEEEDDDEDDEPGHAPIGELTPSVPRNPRPPTSSGSTGQATTLNAGRRSTLLLEADLVTDAEYRSNAHRTGVDGTMLLEAKPIRRKRQVLLVAGLVVLTAVVVALTIGIPLGLQRSAPRPTPDYELVNVTLLRGVFNKTLSNATVDAINRGAATPQAMAYRWLFDGHPELSKDEALERMAHRFALAALYYSTGGNDSWRISTGWLDKAEGSGGESRKAR